MIRVMAMPDWREGNSYQSSLAHALTTEGFETVYPRGYRRILPLARMHKQGAQLLHLHWPEAYFRRGTPFDGLRRLRFTFDLRLATRRRPLVYTAHNFFPHDSGGDVVLQQNYRRLLQTARGIIAHSAAAAAKLREFCPAATGSLHVIPHGDSAEGFPPLPTRSEARDILGLPSGQPMVLMFGRVEPYKGLPEIAGAWKTLTRGTRLWIAGATTEAKLEDELRVRAAGNPLVTLDLRRLSDQDLATRLAAADVVLFNYRRIFTSGAGCLARSLGKKIILPQRLDTVDLMEPAPTVFRFTTLDDLGAVLERALAAPDDPQGTATWRATTSWRRIAELTAQVYRQVLEGPRETAAHSCRV